MSFNTDTATINGNAGLFPSYFALKHSCYMPHVTQVETHTGTIVNKAWLV